MIREELLINFLEPIKVLDKGFIKLVDVMGDDSAITQAARVSYSGAEPKSTDEALIRHLFRNGHLSPFEMCSIKLHIKMPIFCARQFVRHRTGKMNEISGRYRELSDEMYLPAEDVIAGQSTTNKQGRESACGDADLATKFLNILDPALKRIRQEYEALLATGAAKEIARLILPVSQYTEFYWKMDLRNLLHLLKLRMDSHAQYEIRVYANAISQIVSVWVPMTWAAFYDHDLHAVKMSRQIADALFNDFVFNYKEEQKSHVAWSVQDGVLVMQDALIKAGVPASEAKEFMDSWWKSHLNNF